MTDKLPFALSTGPERGTLLPIKMDCAKWFAIAERNDALRVEKMQRCWSREELIDLYEATQT